MNNMIIASIVLVLFAFTLTYTIGVKGLSIVAGYVSPKRAALVAGCIGLYTAILCILTLINEASQQ